MTAKTLKTNFHTHTTYCDGKNTAEEMTLAAIERNIDILGFSGHSMFPFAADWHIAPREHRAYCDEIAQLQKKYADRIRILLGFEVDFVPGMSEPRFDRFTDFHPDYLIGSVHYIPHEKRFFSVDASPAELVSGVRDAFGGDAKKAVGCYFSLQREMLLHGDCTILGHADLIRKFNSTLRLFDERDTWYKKEVQATAQAAAQANVIVEINTGAISRGYMDTPYPSAYFLQELHERNVPITINSDAHTVAAIDCAFDLAAEHARRAGYTEKAVLTADGIRFCAL